MKANHNPDLTKVVIVDDSQLIASRLKLQLGVMPEVEISGIAADIASATSLIESTNPDAVILDIYLKEDAPGRSGIMLLNMLRQSNAQLKIIMLTNLSGPEYQSKCMGLGADFFLDKSTEFEKIPELLLQIHNALHPQLQ